MIFGISDLALRLEPMCRFRQQEKEFQRKMYSQAPFKAGRSEAQMKTAPPNPHSHSSIFRLVLALSLAAAGVIALMAYFGIPGVGTIATGTIGSGLIIFLMWLQKKNRLTNLNFLQAVALFLAILSVPLVLIVMVFIYR